jgi:hypothetical protein
MAIMAIVAIMAIMAIMTSRRTRPLGWCLRRQSIAPLQRVTSASGDVARILRTARHR